MHGDKDLEWSTVPEMCSAMEWKFGQYNRFTISRTCDSEFELPSRVDRRPYATTLSTQQPHQPPRIPHLHTLHSQDLTAASHISRRVLPGNADSAKEALQQVTSGDDKVFGIFHDAPTAPLVMGTGHCVFIGLGMWELCARSGSTEGGTVGAISPKSCFCSVMNGIGRSREQRQN